MTRPADDGPPVEVGSIWVDTASPHRRLKVTHVTDALVEAKVTWSDADDAWDFAAKTTIEVPHVWRIRYRPEQQ